MGDPISNGCKPGALQSKWLSVTGPLCASPSSAVRLVPILLLLLLHVDGHSSSQTCHQPVWPRWSSHTAPILMRCDDAGRRAIYRCNSKSASPGHSQGKFLCCRSQIQVDLFHRPKKIKQRRKGACVLRGAPCMHWCCQAPALSRSRRIRGWPLVHVCSGCWPARQEGICICICIDLCVIGKLKWTECEEWRSGQDISSQRNSPSRFGSDF